MNLRKVQDVNFSGAKVLVRVDFNVPIKDGKVADDTRIRESLRTIVKLVEDGALVMLASHLGRPKGGPDPAFTLAPIAPVLETLLNAALAADGKPPVVVKFVGDCVGEQVAQACGGWDGKSVFLLENTRFYPAEEKNDPAFAAELAANCTHFVNDAFGSCHRAHASTEGVAHLRPSYAGFLVQKEVEFLSKVVDNPARPFFVILGGAKISGKIDVLSRMCELADRVFIGGAMAFTFARAFGLNTGNSLVEEDKVELAGQILERADKLERPIGLPRDVIVTDSIENPTSIETRDFADIRDGDIGVDIGPATCNAYKTELSEARTVFWNGPMGVFEKSEFAAGTFAIAHALAALDAVTVVGGGESAMAADKAGVADRITHISTGGGASLEFVEGKVLPGLAALEEGRGQASPGG